MINSPYADDFKIEDFSGYTNENLIYILENKTLSVGQGNKIVLELLKRLIKSESK